jgi:hypothetical protein
MRYKKYGLPIMTALLLLITMFTGFALAGDPLEADTLFLESDPDLDELPTYIEFLLGTDPYNSDSDNDGLPDNWEYENLMNPADSSDAHDDFDYIPTTNFSVGEREANYEAIVQLGDGTAMVWPADISITFTTPVFDEDGPHYDNYEEYYRPYRDQNDELKVKIMKTNPNNPDCDGDGILDPDDYEPFNFKNDGLGAGGYEAPEEVKPFIPDNTMKKVEVSGTENQANNDVSILYFDYSNEPEYQTYDINVEETTQPPADNKNNLKDADNDGI